MVDLDQIELLGLAVVHDQGLVDLERLGPLAAPVEEVPQREQGGEEGHVGLVGRLIVPQRRRLVASLLGHDGQPVAVTRQLVRLDPGRGRLLDHHLEEGARLFRLAPLEVEIGEGPRGGQKVGHLLECHLVVLRGREAVLELLGLHPSHLAKELDAPREIRGLLLFVLQEIEGVFPVPPLGVEILEGVHRRQIARVGTHGIAQRPLGPLRIVQSVEGQLRDLVPGHGGPPPVVGDAGGALEGVGAAPVVAGGFKNRRERRERLHIVGVQLEHPAVGPGGLLVIAEALLIDLAQALKGGDSFLPLALDAHMPLQNLGEIAPALLSLVDPLERLEGVEVPGIEHEDGAVAVDGPLRVSELLLPERGDLFVKRDLLSQAMGEGNLLGEERREILPTMLQGEDPFQILAGVGPGRIEREDLPEDLCCPVTVPELPVVDGRDLLAEREHCLRLVGDLDLAAQDLDEVPPACGLSVDAGERLERHVVSLVESHDVPERLRRLQEVPQGRLPQGREVKEVALLFLQVHRELGLASKHLGQLRQPLLATQQVLEGGQGIQILLVQSQDLAVVGHGMVGLPELLVVVAGQRGVQGTEQLALGHLAQEVLEDRHELLEVSGLPRQPFHLSQ
jgi:hypothetical protein